jgi:KDO2-lipid IV(A) lauroyltransferase
VPAAPGPDPRWLTHGLNNGWFFTLSYRLVLALPRVISYGLADIGTWIAWRTMRDTTHAIEDNLRAVVPDAPPRELSRLALATYRSYARDVADFMRGVSAPPGETEAMFTPHGIDTIYRVREQGRGALIVTGHFGNWELGGLLMRSLGLPLDVVAMPEADEQVNRMRHAFRQQMGIETIEVRQSLDTALQIRQRLAQNRSVAILMDRHVDRDRVEVQFFGRRAYFLRTPVLLSYLTGAPIVPCFIIRKGSGRFDVIAEEAIDVDHALPRDQGVQQVAQRFAAVLEQHIRRRPECWYQFYPYWQAQTESE